MTCDFVSDDGASYRQSFFGDDLSNLQKFKKVLNRNTISLCFFGREKKGVKSIGIFRHNGRMVFVSSETAITVGGERVDTICTT